MAVLVACGWWLGSNHLTSIPAEIGRLINLNYAFNITLAVILISIYENDFPVFRWLSNQHTTDNQFYKRRSLFKWLDTLLTSMICVIVGVIKFVRSVIFVWIFSRIFFFIFLNTSLMSMICVVVAIVCFVRFSSIYQVKINYMIHLISHTNIILLHRSSKCN